MSDSIQIKLKHIAITAEELLAELRGRESGIAVTGDLADVANSLPGPLHYRMQQEISELRRHLGKVMSERDALQARIDAGDIVYSNHYGWAMTEGPDTTHTARIIDRQPIAQDERKGDRRKVEYIGHVQEGHRMYHRKDFGYTRASRTLHGKNDRRRTPGTRADRMESK